MLKNPPEGWNGPTKFQPGAARPQVNPNIIPGNYSNGFAGIREFLSDVNTLRGNQVAQSRNPQTPIPSMLSKVNQ